MEENQEWFGIVRWCEEDLKSALEENGFPVTDKNVAELYNRLQHHSFTDCMIATGWDFINDTISNLDYEGNLATEE